MNAIKRGNTAIARTKQSRPYRILEARGIIQPDWNILDYGCGKGYDVIEMAHKGYNIIGYDEFIPDWIIPDRLDKNYDMVVSNYVINVIEDVIDREQYVLKCLKMSDSVVFTVRADSKSIKENWTKYNDGWLTPKGTFQKFYTMDDLVDELQYYTERYFDIDITILSDTQNEKMVLVRKCY